MSYPDSPSDPPAVDPHAIRTPQALREVIGEPNEVIQAKIMDALDSFAIDYIEHSPFLILSTSDRDGQLDASIVPILQEEKRQLVRKAGLIEYVAEGITLDHVGGLVDAFFDLVLVAGHEVLGLVYVVSDTHVRLSSG